MDWGNSITYLAEARVKGEWKRFGVKDADRVSHMALVGRIGSGRAAFLTNMALQDVARSLGVVILDGAGNFAQTFLERFPKEALERLIVLDPSDGEHPLSYNALDDFRTLGAEEAVVRLSKTLAEMYQCAMGEIVGFAASLMLSRKDATLLTLFDLVDTKNRDRWLSAGHPARQEWDALLAKEPEVAAAIAENGKYLAKDVLMRNVLGQVESKFTLGELKKGAICVIDFSRIRMFPTRIAPLVRLFLHAAKLYGSAGAPVPIYMHDALKYLSLSDLEHLLLDRTVALTVSDTSRGEEDTSLREKLLHRAGSVLSFSPHEADTPLVERVFYPYVAPEELDKLEDGQLVLALAIDSVRSRPFFARVLPPLERSGVSPLDLALDSRNKYTSARLTVDKMFRPKPKEEEKKAEDPGSFSDAFRSIFTKRAGADDAAKAPAAPGAAGAQKAPPPKVAKEPDKKQIKMEDVKAPPKPVDIPEEKLKKMVHVKNVRHIKPKSS